MAGKKIGIVLALDGEKEFRQGISNAKKETQMYKSEINKLSAEYEGNANSLEFLQKKQEALEKQTKSYEKQIKNASDGLKNAESVQKRAAARYEELKGEVDNARKALEEMAEAGQEGTKDYKNQEKSLQDYEKALARQGDELAKCEGKVTDWQTKLNNAEKDVTKANSALKQNEKYLKEAEAATDNCATSIDEYGNAVQGATEVTTSWGEKLKSAIVTKGVSMGVDAIKAGVEAVGDAMVDSSKASAQLAASTGLSESAAKRYQKVMQQIKGDNYGEDYQDVADAMSQVIQIMGELDDADMTNITESAITLRDTFGMDVNESIRAVDVMMKTMGVDAEKAFDLITTGAQNGLNRSGELVDNITEYGQLWGQAGFSAEEMFAILENGLDSGAYNLDKVNDYVKEFGVSLADGRIEETLSSFSAETQNLFTQWKNGEASTKDVFYSVINDLSSMTNQQEALTLASTVWSALGEDNAMQVITALDDVNDKYSEVKGSMESLKEVKYDDLQSAVSGVGSALQEHIIAPIADGALPVITTLAEGATTAIEKIGEAISPQKTEVELFVEDVKAARDELNATMEESDKTVTDAEESAARLGILGDQLISLNGIEEKSLGQKQRLKTIVEELSETVPTLAEAYDEEAGKINLSDVAIRNLITSTKDLMMAQAMQTAMQEEVNALAESTVALEKAKIAQSALQEESDFWTDLSHSLAELNEAWLTNGLTAETYAQGVKNAQDTLKQGLDEGKISAEEYQAAMESLEGNGGFERAMNYAGEAAVNYAGKNNEAAKSLSELEAAQKDAQDSCDQMEAAIENLSDAQEKSNTAEFAAKTEQLTGELDNEVNGLSIVTAGMSDLNKTTKEMTDSQEDATVIMGSAAEAAGEAAGSQEDLAETYETTAEAAKAAATAQEEAAERIISAFNDTKNELQSGLQDKISLFDFFEDSDGGEDQTVEEMQKNLNSQIEAFEEYQKNLEAVKDHVGKEIAPEFMQYIEDMGMDGANTLKHILATFEDGDADKVKELSDSYLKAMDMTEGIAEVGAANRTAYQAAMGELGSTDLEFDDLKNAISQAVSSAADGWSGLSDTTEAELNNMVSAAQECGVKIPDGLTDGIKNGEISAKEAIATLKGSIQGQMDGLAEIAGESGNELMAQLAAAIESGDANAIVSAYDNLMGVIEAKSSELAAKAAEGMDAGQSDMADASAATAQAGADAMAENTSGYTEAGSSAAEQYTAGITSGSKSAVNAAGNMASSAAAAVRAYQNSFYSAGVNMASGVAGGINAGASGAINAAASMASRSLSAAKAALDIHSPSKKFQKEVGEQISAGMAFGIKNKASLAGKQAKKMSNQVYKEATSWLSKYKKDHEVSLADEKYYWEQVIKHTKKGTTAYNNALKKLNTVKIQQSSGLSSSISSKIAGNFGVERTTTTGSGKNKKTTKKSDADYYSEIYSAAKKYVDNQQILNEWSLQQQISYWTQVQKRLKKGTDAWYDATAQIKSLQEEQKQAEEEAKAAAEQAAKDALTTRAQVQDDILSKYKTYYKVSAKAEADYWDIARKQFKTGTDERIEADQKYFDALQNLYDERQELDEEYAKNSQDINDQLIEDIEDLQDAYKDAVASRKEDILSQMDLFEAWDSSGYDADTLLYNLKTQVAGLALWEQQLEELGKKGLASRLMEELKEMGPEAAANIYSLNQMTAEQLEEYNKLWEQKNALAESQAVKDNETLRQDTNSQISQIRSEAQAELSALNAEYKAAIQELNTGISSDLRNLVNKAGSIGEEAVSGMIGAIGKAANSVETYNSTTKVVNTVSSQLSTLAQEGTIIGTNTLDGILAGMTDYNKIDTASREVIQSIKKAMEDEAQIHSPSRLFRRETGPQIPAGVAEGMVDGTKIAVKSSRNMVKEILDATMEEMDRQQKEFQVPASMNYSGITRLNRALADYQTPQTTVNVDNSSLATLLGTLIGAVNNLSEKMDSQQMVLDTGVLVAAIQPQMSQENAAVTVRRNRGRL